MRLPSSPPDFSSLTRELVHSGRFDDILKAPQATKYYHWDKLLRFPPPEGLTHREWWFAIKLRRQGNFRAVPLADPDGNPFKYTVTDPVHEQLHRIDMGAGGSIGVAGPITNQQTRDQYYVTSLIREAITSSQLEGATTTREVAKEMIRTGRPPRDKGERMILNNYLTMREISDAKDEELTPALVFEFHRRVTDQTLDNPDAAGRFRHTDEDIQVWDHEDNVVHTPPPAQSLQGRLESLCAFANEIDGKPFLHPVLRAIIVHFWLGYDHPFVDGNGLTTRALFYWCMRRYGFWLFEFVSISNILVNAPAQYSRSFLYSETDDNDLTYFIDYQIGVIRRAIDTLHEYIDRKSREINQLRSQLRVVGELNHRQQTLMNHALKHPYNRYTIESHRNSHGIVYQTARTDLLKLSKLGLLEQSKQGKTLVFEVPSDLPKRMETLSTT